jgi:hypothetical protein
MNEIRVTYVGKRGFLWIGHWICLRNYTHSHSGYSTIIIEHFVQLNWNYPADIDFS